MSITSLTSHNGLLGPFAIIQTSASSHLPMPSSGVQEPSFAHGSLPEKSIILIYFPGTGKELEGLALSLLGPASLSTVKASDTTKVLETEGAYLLSGTGNPVRTLLRLLLCPPNAYCLLGCKVPCLGPNILISGLVHEDASLVATFYSQAKSLGQGRQSAARWSVPDDQPKEPTFLSKGASALL